MFQSTNTPKLKLVITSGMCYCTVKIPLVTAAYFMLKEEEKALNMALYEAAKAGNAELVIELINSGDDVNAQDLCGVAHHCT